MFLKMFFLIYIYIYVCVCVCVCIYMQSDPKTRSVRHKFSDYATESVQERTSYMRLFKNCYLHSVNVSKISSIVNVSYKVVAKLLSTFKS